MIFIQFTGAFLRYIYNLLTGNYRPFNSYFYCFKIYNSENVDEKIDNENKNSKIGFIVAVILLIIIFISLN